MQSRREFLNGITAAGLLPASSRARRFNSMPIKAIVFDAFPILDVRPVYSLGERLFPEKGTELANLWRARQFEYMWLRSLSGHYSDFLSVTADALVFAARALKLELDRPEALASDGCLAPTHLLARRSGCSSGSEEQRLANRIPIQHDGKDA